MVTLTLMMCVFRFRGVSLRFSRACAFGLFISAIFDLQMCIRDRGRVTVFHRDEDLPAPEAVAVIVSGHKVAIAEADETNVQQALHSLLIDVYKRQGKSCST